MASETLRYSHSGTASTERVEHDITLVALCSHNAFQESLRPLGGIAKPFGRPSVDRVHVDPYILKRSTAKARLDDPI